MAIKRYKPTSPGAALDDRRGLRGDHADQAGEVAAGRSRRTRPGATTRAASRCGTAAAATSASTASLTSSATSSAFRPRSRRSSTIPTARRASRCCIYADGEKRYILAPLGLKVGDTSCRAPARRSAWATRCRCATSRSAPQIHNIEMQIGRGRPDGAQRGHVRAADGARRRLCPDPHAFRRGAPRPRRLHGDYRPDGQRGPREYPHRQGRAQSRHLGIRPRCAGR